MTHFTLILLIALVSLGLSAATAWRLAHPRPRPPLARINDETHALWTAKQGDRRGADVINESKISHRL